MAYPTKDEFVHLLRTKPPNELVHEQVFGGTPFVFRDTPADYDALRDHLGAQMNIPRENLTIIGSGKIGFSLAPDRFGVPFGEHSDVDVLVVSEALFDSIWLDLLRLPRSYFARLSRRNKTQIHNHVEQIYWGRMWPNDLVRVSRAAGAWVGAFRSLSRNPRLARYETSGRLYRTWDHAEVYHVDRLTQLAEVVQHGV